MNTQKDRWLTTVVASMIVIASLNLELVIKIDSDEPLNLPSEVEELLITSD